MQSASNLRRPAWGHWAAIAFLFALCGSLAILQNRWLQELSDAEDARLHRDLQDNLKRIQEHFDGEIRRAAGSLVPSADQIRERGVERAVASAVAGAKGSASDYFSRMALAIADGDTVRLIHLVPGSGSAQIMEWPPEWSSTREEMDGFSGNPARGPSGARFSGPPRATNPTLLEIPLHGGESGKGMRGPEPQRLLLELNLGLLRRRTLPDLLSQTLDKSGQLEYQAEVTSNRNPSFVIYRTAVGKEVTRRNPDASVDLLRIGELGLAGPPGMAKRPRNSTIGGMGPPGLWRLTVRYKPGALEAFIVRTRLQSAAVSAVLLVLILVTGAALVRYSRNAQKVAEIQFNFVAGVSHELRTPVTVIRTASFNLHGELARRPDHVERYADIIQAESEKLSALLEQVLLFGSARSGNLVQSREETSVADLIEQAAADNLRVDPRVTVERVVEEGLPLISADRTAVQQALSNLLANAVKYGVADGGDQEKWVGISARVDTGGNPSMVEIRVVDHGPGIPLSEQKLIFEPFFRGTRPAGKQVHGTGLGLSLVRHIIAAHGGTVTVVSQPGRGAEFIVRLPIARAATMRAPVLSQA